MFDKDKPCFSRPNLRTITFRNLLQNSLVVIFLSRYRSKKHLYKVPCFFLFSIIYFQSKMNSTNKENSV